MLRTIGKPSITNTAQITRQLSFSMVKNTPKNPSQWGPVRSFSNLAHRHSSIITTDTIRPFSKTGVSPLKRNIHTTRPFNRQHMNVLSIKKPIPQKSFSYESVRFFSSLVPTPVSEKEIAPVEKETQNITTLDAINQDKGLSDFIKRTYWFTGGGITATLALSQALSLVQTPDFFLPALGIGFLTSIGSIIGLSYTKYTIHQKQILVKDKNLREKIIDYWYSRNTNARLASYAGLVTGMSLSFSPMVAIVNDIAPTILPASVLLTSCVFGGSLLYAKMRPKGALLAWEAPLMGGLLGLVGMGVVGLGSQLIFGPNLFSAALHSIDTYGGLILFTGMTAYDTHKAIDFYEKRDPDHLGMSVSFYLDFMNILIRIMEIMAKAQQKK